MVEKRNLLDLQRDYGVTEDQYDSAVSTLRVLRFKWNNYGKNIVSQIDRTIVFVETNWDGQWPQAGETWLCYVYFRGTVYQSQPLMRIDASFLMGLDGSFRQEIYKALWETNKKDFVKIFESKYRETALASAHEQLEVKHQDEIDALNAKITSLETQLKQSQMMLNSRSRPDEMILTSEKEPEKKAPVRLSTGPETIAELEEERPLSIPSTYRQTAPGIPEAARARDQLFRAPRTIVYKVYRVGENLIRSDSFAEGKYFVHMSPNRKYLVVRPNKYGSVVAVNSCLHLGGLNEASPFVGETELLAEYSEKYGGMLITL